MISYDFRGITHSDSDFCWFPPGGEGGESGTGGTPRHGEGLAALVSGGRAPTPRCTGHAGHAGHGWLKLRKLRKPMEKLWKNLWKTIFYHIL